MTVPVRRLTLAALLVVPLVFAPPASAQEGSATRGSMTLKVSKATGLAADGEKVRVRGSGYDRSKGIYIAFCVLPPAGQPPTPCGGGADTEGRSGNSVWISDLPPAYGTGLARPYGSGGSFDVEISVRLQLNEDVDCREVRCAVVTRADHTRSEDRTADVFVPIAFAAPAAAPAPAGSSSAPTSAAGGTAPPRAGGSTATTSGSTQAGATAPASPAPSTPSAAPTTTAAPSAAATETPAATTDQTSDDTTVAAPDRQAVAPVDSNAAAGVGWPLAAGGLLAVALAGAGLGAGRVLLGRRAARLRG